MCISLSDICQSATGHHSFGACLVSAYGPTQSAICIWIDLHHAVCIFSTSSAEFPFEVTLVQNRVLQSEIRGVPSYN